MPAIQKAPVGYAVAWRCREAVMLQQDLKATSAWAVPSGRFVFVDALRGLAALSVACYHIDRYGPLREPAEVWIPSLVKFLVQHGWVGVQMFFVISGFVIAYSIRGAPVTPGYLGGFALRRSIRLDPPYWTAIVCVLAMHALSPLAGVVPSPMDSPPQAGQIVAHLFYLQNLLGYENLSVGFWTLCIEVQFYLLLVILMGVAQRLPWTGSSPEKGASGLSLMLTYAPLAVASLFVFHLDSAYDNWVIYFFCMFFLGSLAWWSLEGRIPAALFWLYVVVMLIRLALHWKLDLPVAVVTGVSIYCAGRLGHLYDWCSQPWLQFLGRISYSLYLVHYPVSHVVVNVGYELTGDASVPAVLWVLLAMAASIGVAHLLYTFVEAPSVRLAARFKRSRQRPVVARVPVAEAQ